MERPNANPFTPPTINSWEHYLSLVENYDAATAKVLEECGKECPPPGSLSWPGDLQLLQKYGVTCQELFDKLKPIMEESFGKFKNRLQKQHGKFEDLSHLNAAASDKEHVQDKLVDVVYKFNEKLIDKIKCTYCKEMLLCPRSFSIYSKNTKEQPIKVDDSTLHYLEKHSDLGPPADRSIDPTKTCFDPTKVCQLFKLGNTDLRGDDPLYLVAKYGKKPLAELPKSPAKPMVIPMGTLMLSRQSGRI